MRSYQTTLVALAVLFTASSALDFDVPITPTLVSLPLDGTKIGHTFEGHGALSAGASSRLLWDYPEPQRSQILDYLFKPNFGAGMQILKVEIGGDAQSTDGTEPSHSHFRGDLSCTRGYERWLINEAKIRNPDVILYGLIWGAPLFVNNGTFYGPEMIQYKLNWLNCIATNDQVQEEEEEQKQEEVEEEYSVASSNSGWKVDFIGLHNEAAQPSPDYVIQLRQAMDAAGFENTKIIVMDGGYDESEVATAQTNATYREAVFGAGLHYPCNKPQPEVRDLGWTFWASEDYSRDPAWDSGGRYWGSTLSQNYVLMNMTATISWSLIWSAYTNLVCNGAGLMRAHTPWSGNYEVSAPIFLTSHWTQFASPGWQFLSVPGGGSGFLPGPPDAGSGSVGGTYVTLIPPASSQATTASSDVTIILETMYRDDCYARNMTNYNITFILGAGLPGPGTVLHVWSTTQSAYFVQLPDITVAADGSINLALDADTMMTVSTINTATHGSFPSSPIPAASDFPIPYTDDFNSYAYDTMATYFSDQGGSWAARNGTLQQVAQADPGPNGWAENPNPLTQIGGEDWEDYAISVSVTFSSDIPGGPLPVLPPSSPSSSLLSSTLKQTSIPRRRLMERQRQWKIGHHIWSAEDEAAYQVTISSSSSTSSSSSSDAAASVELLRDVPTNLFKCDSSDSAQIWAFNNPAPGYLSNSNNLQQLCLNIGGCVPDDIIYYQCVTDPNSSACGAPNGQYPNLMWAWNETTGAVTSPMDGFALTLNATNTQSMYMSPFTPGNTNQQWYYNSTSGQLSLPSLDLCLSTAPQRVYAQVCGRVTSFNGFSALSDTPGYCIQIDHTGAWTLVSNSIAIQTGVVPLPFNSTASHALALSMAGPVIAAYIDTVRVIEVIDTSFSVGNSLVGSGWHVAAFDNLNVTVPYPEELKRSKELLQVGE